MLFSTASEKRALLEKVPVFSGLGGKYLRKIEQLVYEMRVRSGAVLVRQGKSAVDFYLIVDGQARVERNAKKIKRLGPGDFFGEISLIDRGPRMANVIAETDMTVLAISSQDFARLMDTTPGFSKAILKALCRYIREAWQDW